MTRFSGRGHSYRVQKPISDKTLKSNQKAAEDRKRKGDEAKAKLEEVQAELKAVREEKAEARKEQMLEFVRAEMAEPQAELKAQIEKWKARNARAEEGRKSVLQRKHSRRSRSDKPTLSAWCRSARARW